VKRTMLAAATVTAVAALAAAPGASAAVHLSGGKTTLKLNRGTAAALDGLGVSVAPVGRARAGKAGVRFPITGGRIDARTAAGTIRHAGGLRFRAGGHSLTLRSPQVTVGRKIMLSARVGGSRVHLLQLSGARVSRSGFNTNVSGLRARLTQKAAKALNATFGVKAFKKGLLLGTATVRSKTNEADILARNATSLEVDAGALAALTSLGIAPGVIAPATLTGTTAAFPISGGRVKLDLTAGTIRHQGGISLTKGSTVVRLESFDVRLGASPQLFASINGGAQKAAILDLDLTGVTPQVSGRTVTLAGVTAKLTQGAADALNAAFGTTAFSAGLVLGRATVVAAGA
jgi:hypothetical protein